MRKRIFFTADWHLGHENCLQFDNRPFQSLDDMERTLIKRFNATVPRFGLTYFLGDMGRTPRLKEVLQKLNGTHVLVLGNHDHKMHGMYNKGFHVVVNSASLIIAKQIVTLSHCPLTGVWREDTSNFKNSTPGENWHREKYNVQYSVPNFGQFHLHGHTHMSKERGSVKSGRQWDVGVVGNNYQPVSISQVESWINKTLKEGE